MNYVCAGGMQHITRKLFTRLQLCFGPHLNQRFRKEIMGLQNARNPNFRNFKIFNLGDLGKMTFGCNPYG
jgi:hypothetical protein